MKKIVMVLMIIMSFMTLIGGYISCSDIYYEPYLKAGVGFELFGQLLIYFFQGMLCGAAKMSRKINFIAVSISVIGSLIIMFIYDFLGIEVKIFVLLFCIIMYLIGYKLYKVLDILINKMKIKITEYNGNKE